MQRVHRPTLLPASSPIAFPQRLGQSFVIENRVGANGSLAAEAVSRATPDGYTLLLAGSSVIATNPFLYPKTSSAIISGLTPLTNLTGLDFVLAVRPSLAQLFC